MISGITFEDIFSGLPELNTSDFFTANDGDTVAPPVESITPSKSMPLKEDDESWEPSEESTKLKSKSKKRARHGVDELYDSIDSEILALQNRIIETRNKQASCQLKDPKEKRAARNIWSALISRTKKRLNELFKEKEIETLKAELNECKAKNVMLENDMGNLRSQYQTLLNQFTQLASKCARENQTSADELCVGLPHSTIFVKYQSPTTSPRKPMKPLNHQTLDSPAIVRSKLMESV